MTDAPRAQAGWYPDPAGRHQQRFWDGSGWTIDVADNGVPGFDDRVKATMAEQGGATTAAVAIAATAATPVVDAPSARRSGRSVRSLVIAAIVAVATVAGFLVARAVL